MVPLTVPCSAHHPSVVQGGAAAPKRTVKDGGDGAAGGGSAGGSLNDALPRVDISAKLEEAFIDKFSSTNWKVRMGMGWMRWDEMNRWVQF